MEEFESRFAIRSYVYIDEDKTLKARVTGLIFREEIDMVELGWMHNGTAQTACLQAWRLTEADDDDA